ncbi:putative activating signal cointegrator 1 complex subunit 3 [Golovinomyces cichoracearum]|uniref:Putative activating signal cointegrator 1 complex subunit 3 n=1 Tax=Golovinomyces cichoracearum TaxID=62708 RepID=A0A420H7R0_9PEZI|nr:putative activating signal cointegrator 1 complex subunit 3 [Golovinomyces cichoracearum]
MDSAETQWQSELTAMKMSVQGFISDSRFNFKDLKPYGSDIDYNDENLISGENSSDSWDFASESEEDDSTSGCLDYIAQETETARFSSQWLESKCQELASRSQCLAADDLFNQIMALISSDSSEEEFQCILTDIIGLDDMDFIIDIITHRSEIKAHSSSAKVDRLLTRSQREEALKRRNYEHKNAQLKPSLSRDEPRYPHVFKAHSAGNILDSKGRKYGLPSDSKRISNQASLSLKSCPGSNNLII